MRPAIFIGWLAFFARRLAIIQTCGDKTAYEQTEESCRLSF
jgi:hypothetical protein